MTSTHFSSDAAPSAHPSPLRCAEQLLLLLVDDAGKPDRWISMAEPAIRAGAVADLALSGTIALSNEKRTRITLASGPTPAGYENLVEALNGKRNRRGFVFAYTAISSWWFDARAAAAKGLAQRGIVEAEHSSFLGFPRTTVTIKDHEPERELRTRIAAVLHGREVPQAEELITLNILKQLNVAKRVLGTDVPSLKRRDINKRIDAITRAFEASASSSPESRTNDIVIRALKAVQTMVIAAAST